MPPGSIWMSQKARSAASVDRSVRRSSHNYRYASMYSAMDEGSGISKPSSRIPSMCMRIASRIRSSTSALVAPVATQPGKSGENADRLFEVFSITIRYFGVTILVFQSSLPQDAIQRARG